MSDGISIEIKFTPTIEQVKAKFDAIQKSLDNKIDPFTGIQVYLDAWVQRNFKTEGGKVGGWEKLAAGGRWKTSASGKSVFDSSAKILQDTGRLRLSFVSFVKYDSVSIGSDIPYSKKHEEGQNGLPVRRMLPKYTEISKDVKKIFNLYIAKILNNKKL